LGFLEFADDKNCKDDGDTEEVGEQAKYVELVVLKSECLSHSIVKYLNADLELDLELAAWADERGFAIALSVVAYPVVKARLLAPLALEKGVEHSFVADEYLEEEKKSNGNTSSSSGFRNARST
jgi:hypothetical protein